jgi:hypothetical protein
VPYWFSQKEEVVLRFYSQIFEDGVGPEPFHMVLLDVSLQRVTPDSSTNPIFYLPMANRVVQSVSCPISAPAQRPDVSSERTRSSGGGNGFVADEEVQVFGPSFRIQVPRRTSSASEKRRFVRDGWSPRARSPTSGRAAFCRNRSREYERGGVVAGETWIELLEPQKQVTCINAYQASRNPCRWHCRVSDQVFM